MVQPEAGVLLIADPFLKDPNFMRTVVFLTEHREDGTIGFVLNRQYENTLDELIPEIEGHKIPVYYGGPVQMNTIRFYIGYSGWSPGQLDTEMGEKTWLTVEGARSLIFHPNAEDIWKDSLKHL